MMKKIILLLALSLMMAGVVSAADYYVNPSGDDTTGNGGLDAPWKTIQKAIDSVAAGDTINVAEGTYNGNVLINSKTNLIIQGVGDTTLVEPANGIGFAITDSSSITIKNLKIHTTGTNAHGIWVAGSSDGNNAMNGLTVQDTTIVVDGYSSGIYAAHSSPAHSNWIIGRVGHGNHITINSGTGVTGDGLDLYDVSNSEVSYNDITLNNPTDSTNVLWTSELSNLNNIVFKYNTISGSSGSEVAIVTDFIDYLRDDLPVAPDTNIATVTITGNIFSNWGSKAIRVGTAIGTGTVTGITINSNTFNMTADTTEVIGGTAAGSATGAGNTFNVHSPAKIQKAIDAAFAGDTINVAAGTYAESLTVNKRLSIIGVGPTTIIQPAQDSDGITITANNVLVKDLKVSTSNSGVNPNIAISIEGTDGVEINNNVIQTTGNKAMGIWVGGSSASMNPSTNLKIVKNTITVAGVATGIYAAHSNPAHSGWTIGGSSADANTITMASSNAIELYDVSDSEASYNTLTITTPVDASNVIWSSELSNIDSLVFKNNIVDGSSGSEVGILTDFVEDATATSIPPDTTVTTVTISGNTFQNWGSRGLRIGAGVSGVTASTNKFLKTGEALKNEDTSSVTAANNWWGKASGPTHTSNPSGTGGSVSDNVNYDPWCSDSTCAATTDEASTVSYSSTWASTVKAALDYLFNRAEQDTDGVNIYLHKGWNTFKMPWFVLTGTAQNTVVKDALAGDYSVTNVLSSISGKYNYLAYYDGAAWQTNIPGSATTFTNFPTAATNADYDFHIYMTASDRLVIE